MFQYLKMFILANQISISRVYPCFNFLREKLLLNDGFIKYTRQLRQDLYDSLITRFENLVDQDLFKLSTILDPNFGISAFESSKHDSLKQLLKSHMKSLNSVTLTIDNVVKTIKPIEQTRNNNYVFYKKPQLTNIEKAEDFDLSIDSYCTLVDSSHYTDVLEFWKINEYKYQELAKLAKKFLGVQASSASVERMFNFAGQIFSNKRRRTGVKLFENLVFLKLNETYLN